MITNRSFLSEPWQHAVLVAILFLFNCHRVTARDWIKMTSARGEVFSNAGPAPAKRVLEQFDWMANAFQSFGPNRRTQPLKVMIFASEREFADYRPSAISTGFYQSGPDGDWICFYVPSDRVALHEFTHSLLNRTTTQLPQWLEEGLAEFFSTLRIDKGRIVIGSSIPGHIANLSQLDLLPASELIAGSKQSIHYADPVAAGRFYATSWALVHMLYLSPRYAARMPQFVQAIDAAAIPPEQAFAQAFGISIEEALVQVRGYLQPGRRLATTTIAIDNSIPTAPISEPKPMDLAAITNIQAELLLDAGHREKAAGKYQELVKLKTESSLIAQAFLAMSRNEMTSASRFFEKLLENPQAEARTVFEYAMLLRDTGAADRARVTELLQRTVRQNPSHPEANFLLGVRATDEKRYAEAVEHLREAVAILPRQSSFWHALGYAYSRLGNGAEALKAALKAVRLAETEQQEKMARDLLQGLATPTSSQTSASVDKPMPASWQNRQGDATATGTLREFVCSNPPRIRLQTVEGLQEFVILHPEKLVFRNAPSTQVEFVCGPLDPQVVKIEYLRSTRDITKVDYNP